MKLFTIGFTGKSAERFFGLLEKAEVKVLIDTRLNNRSQLAGFTKAGDLPFFLGRIGNISYRHALELAPAQQMLDDYKKRRMSWDNYTREYTQLLIHRRVEEQLSRSELDLGCLLCSEHSPDQCHRRLAAEYLKQHWTGVEIVHLV